MVKQTRLAHEPLAYAPLHGFHTDALALDVPVLIPLGRDVTASCYFDAWGATTVHLLTVRVSVGTLAATETSYVQTFPVAIKMYDTLPLYRQFNEPVVELRLSADSQVVVEAVLPTSAVGPHDTIGVTAKVAANPLHNRRKKDLQLRLVALQLREVFECFDGGLPVRKELRLYHSTVDYGQRITTEGILTPFTFPFPHGNDLLELYTPFNTRDFARAEVSTPLALFNKNKNYPKLAEGVPLTHVQGFSVLGKLYLLRYELVLKVRIAHGKDVEMALPLTVAPFNRAASGYLLLWIKSECQLARERFGKDVVAAVVLSSSPDDVWRLLQRFCPPPIVYKYTRADWARLGYNPDAFGSPAAGLVAYID